MTHTITKDQAIAYSNADPSWREANALRFLFGSDSNGKVDTCSDMMREFERLRTEHHPDKVEEDYILLVAVVQAFLSLIKQRQGQDEADCALLKETLVAEEERICNKQREEEDRLFLLMRNTTELTLDIKDHLLDQKSFEDLTRYQHPCYPPFFVASPIYYKYDFDASMEENERNYWAAKTNLELSQKYLEAREKAFADYRNQRRDNNTAN